jgi:hypothetical protein
MKLTGKENFLRCLRGELPESVPVYTMGMAFNADGSPAGPPPDMLLVEPKLLCMPRLTGGGKDIWGVEFVPTESTNGAQIPKTSDFILDDIRNWREVVKTPDFSGVDWERLCREDFTRMHIDRSKTAVMMNLHFGYFQTLMSFMGFSNGLMAMYEEPEEVKALFEYLSDFYCGVAARYIDHCAPDVWMMMDDTAAWANPFISPDMYREFLLPLYDRLAKFGRDRGLPIGMHNCGKCESILEDIVGIGVTMWDPAQTCNDLAAIKRKLGSKLVIVGGWDARDRLLADDVTYEELYGSVKATMDLLAPGGGYCFCGGFLGAKGDTAAPRKNALLNKAVGELIHTYY